MIAEDFASMAVPRDEVMAGTMPRSVVPSAAGKTGEGRSELRCRRADGRTPVCRTGGSGFEPRRPRHPGHTRDGMAKMDKAEDCNSSIPGSSPGAVSTQHQ